MVVAGGVEDEFADEFAAVFGDDPQVAVAGQDEHPGAGPGPADADVVESAGVADGELAVGVHPVPADAEVLADLDALSGGDGVGSGGPGGDGGLPVDAAVGPVVVVVVGEGVQLGLQVSQGGGRLLMDEPVLLGLVEAFDAPMFVKPLLWRAVA